MVNGEQREDKMAELNWLMLSEQGYEQGYHTSEHPRTYPLGLRAITAELEVLHRRLRHPPMKLERVHVLLHSHTRPATRGQEQDQAADSVPSLLSPSFSLNFCPSLHTPPHVLRPSQPERSTPAEG